MQTLIYRRYLPAFLAILAITLLSISATTLSTSTHTVLAASYQAQTGQSSPVESATATPSPECTLAWRILDSPNPGPSYNELLAVAAISADDVWAIGHYYTADPGHVGQTLAVHWDGTHWIQTLTPNPGTTDNRLKGISVLSANDVWAVGYYANGNVDNTLVLHWDGSAWTQIPSPGVGMLNGAKAISANDVWVVGDYDAPYTPIMHWNGTGWTQITTTQRGALHSVDGVSANDIWAVGFGSSTETQNLTMHWDGTNWSVVPCPYIGNDYSELFAVKAISSSDIWAVGYHQDQTTHAFHSQALHWDGIQWRLVASPDPGQSSLLLGITATSTNSVWASGTYSTTDGERALLAHWDSTGWVQVSSPNPPMPNSLLWGITSISPDDLWAAGYTYVTFNSSPAQTLIEHYNNPCVTPSPTQTSTPMPPTSTTISTATVTSTHTSTPLPSPTQIISSTALPSTATPSSSITASPTPCPITFTDVQHTDYFYEPVRSLYCTGAISGYSDNTFHPWSNTTRGQLTKIVALAERWNLVNPMTATFADVSYGSTFYQYIETAVSHGVISGYTCGNPEPCDSQSRPYFRPYADVTRAQLAKIIVLAENWPLYNPNNPTFVDVSYGSTFYQFVETASSHTMINGYNCGNPEPCDAQRRPLFRPGNPATRGQIAKMVYNAITSP